MLIWRDTVKRDYRACVNRACGNETRTEAHGHLRDHDLTFRSFVIAHRSHSLTRHSLHELEPLNRILERDDAYGAIVARSVDASDRSASSALEWRTLRRWRTPDSLLLPMAHAIANFLTSEDLSRVKSCEKSPCTLFFLDRTRGQARRWCSMTVCGNRAKQALHRARLKRRQRSAHRPKKTKAS